MSPFKSLLANSAKVGKAGMMERPESTANASNDRELPLLMQRKTLDLQAKETWVNQDHQEETPLVQKKVNFKS